MRLGVLDVGSNTVHLLVVDAHRGAHPTPMSSDKSVLRLAEQIDASGELSRAGADRLVRAVTDARDAAAEHGCEELMAFATSAVREARNCGEVLARVRAETGVELRVLSGEDEARYTFLAARRWLGWSAGQLLVVDIGGGSLELATGIDEDPDVALSVPFGAGRLTRTRLRKDPPSQREVAALRDWLDAQLVPVARRLRRAGAPDRAVATSKTFRTLARLTGAAPSSAGPRVRRVLTDAGLRQLIAFISRMSAADLAELEGVSASRAHQLVAGALVAEATMRALSLAELEICPWALREGVILRRLDHTNGTGETASVRSTGTADFTGSAGFAGAAGTGAAPAGGQETEPGRGGAAGDPNCVTGRTGGHGARWER
ncbi:Ppx/GppA phosphatase family protein [Streptoalloteichus tenebrarius]|uniref:Ppx/GppA phosphatase family protein n=1 Tax=Streptoalloteichus tenebrarius (strain ATCC 17920 / DSM 40477 / JCM 4838 / CBS 697.72 / NBRC 16177 / NCIMB 11028 / NRRL B-12390 / A12253. 1 / ISP 5477) TaxID=1933 RepID=UPI0020A46AEC|nr:Ppx/GppA phosphatase family protein [Streptoalloteichus tenebrarius]